MMDIEWTTRKHRFHKSRKQPVSARTKFRRRYNRSLKRMAKSAERKMFASYVKTNGGLWNYIFHTRVRMFITKYGAPTSRTVPWDGRFRFADGTMLRP